MRTPPRLSRVQQLRLADALLYPIRCRLVDIERLGSTGFRLSIMTPQGRYEIVDGRGANDFEAFGQVAAYLNWFINERRDDSVPYWDRKPKP